MTRLLSLLTFLLVFQWNTFSQETINNYKYIIVPNQYDFQKSDDQYKLNSLTKFLFNKYGYTAFLENEEYPDDMGTNNCLALRAVTTKIKGGFLKTKIQIDLLDCKNRVIASSQIGTSKEKSHEKAYQEAIRAAFITYQFFEYSYNGNAAKIEKNAAVKAPEVKSEVIETEKPSEEKVKEDLKVEPEEIVEAAETVPNTSIQASKDVLYAQPIDNGFQVVDTEPKKVMMLLYSGVKDTFIVQGKDAVVYKKGDIWVYSENDGEKLRTKTINLKF